MKLTEYNKSWTSIEDYSSRGGTWDEVDIIVPNDRLHKIIGKEEANRYFHELTKE
jgi:hypothetical protein